MVEAVAAFLADETKRNLLNKLAAQGVSRAQVANQTLRTGPLSGKSFCVTGVLTRPRDDVHASILAAGGTVHDKVKKGTQFLVAGDKVGKSKLDAAKKNGAEIIDEARLLAMILGVTGDTASMNIHSLASADRTVKTT